MSKRSKQSKEYLQKTGKLQDTIGSTSDMKHGRLSTHDTLKPIPIYTESSSVRPPVLTKHDFSRRYKNLEFGNAAPTWDTWEEYVKSDYRGNVHFRSRIKGGPTFYDVSYETAPKIWKYSCAWNANDWYISAMAPHHRGTIQGEVLQTERGLSLLWTHAKLPMREALAEWSKQDHGLVAVLLLRKYMCPKSYDWLQCLLEFYPLHAIEFTCFSRNWGTLPGFNTVVWECRKY